MPVYFIQKYLRLEAFGGILLFLSVLLAFILSNSPLSHGYQAFFETPLEIQVGSLTFAKPLLFWINEGLMTIFFLLVGLELKREFISGELNQISKIVLPAFAAFGGMLIPGLIFAAINFNHPDTLKGWSIPVATDIAFALGVLSLFGKRIPLGLKLFLMALAIFDDVGAILIIAVVHTKELSIFSLLAAVIIMLGLALLNYFRVRQVAPYILLGIILWVSALQSGIHATIAGVMLAFFIPSKAIGHHLSPAARLETSMHPWVSYLVMPLFALANAGVSLQGFSKEMLIDALPLGVIAGLVFGKQFGVFSFAWLAIRSGWAKSPGGATWPQIYGVALLCGIGFTMSLFLGTLAFEHDNPIYITEVRLSVLLGSILSGMIGALVLSAALKKRGSQFEASQ